MNPSNQQDQNMLPEIHLVKRWRSFAILIVSIFLTILATIYTYHDLKAIAKSEFTLESNEIKTKIHLRLHTHAQLLRSGSALFATSNEISRKDWKAFIENSKLNSNLPGIQGVGFSVIIKKEQLEQHILQIKKEGFPEYVVHPTGDREIYTSIIYLEPFTNRNLRAFGYDMYSETVRRSAMEQACDLDMATLSGKVILVQETKTDVQPGTLMYVAVYRKGMPINTKEERRTAIFGWIYSPYRMVDLMQGILGGRNLTNNTRLRIYDNDEISLSSLLFDSQSKDTIAPSDNVIETHTIPIVFNGKIWTLVFSKPGGPLANFHGEVFTVLLSGITISLLLFSLSWSLNNTRFRAQQIANQLTAKINEIESKFSLFMDHLPASAFIKDRYGRNLFFNRQLIELMGFKNWENKLNRDLMDETDALRVSADDIMTMEKGNFKLEENLMDGNGLIRTFETLKFIIPRQGQEPLLGGISIDITERKIIDEKIKQHEIHLSELNASKDKFFSIIAHDLKSPFNSIIGFSSLLVQHIKDKDIQGINEYGNLILKSANNAMDLLQNLMDWSRSQTGRMEFQPVYVDLVPLVNKTTLFFDDIARQKSITIKRVLENTASIYADIAMLNTVLRNLISNAIKFTMPGGEIIVSVMKKQNEIIFSVSDTGVGISKNGMEKLFRIEHSYSTSGTNKETGTGLGLILCKDFIEKHNGKIWVESEEGKGSKFYFSLPFNAQLQEKKPIENFGSSATNNHDDPVIASLKILIAEDDEISKILLCHQLKTVCKEILKATTGIEAITICRDHPDIDLLLMDINMPEMNGFIATQQIREFNTKVIIIAQTAHALTGAREKSIASGCNDFISKPINKNELLALIKKYFG